MEEIKNWIIHWFVTNTDFKQAEIQNGIDANYFDQHWVDSFQFISFVADLEGAFSVSFDNEEFQDKNFTTINGLSRLVDAKRTSK